MKKLLASRKGEMYIDALITCFLILAFLVFALSTFKVSSVRNTGDVIADRLLETACYYGSFGTEFQEEVTYLQEKYPGLEFTVSYSGEWYNESLQRVQLGGKMEVVVSYSVSFGGFGSFISVPLTSVRTGASENFWKTGVV